VDRINYDVFADWLINNFCNFKCEYCHPMGSDKGHNIEKIINGFDETKLTWWIRMSGGEPFFQPNFEHLCKGLEKHFISINTNLSAKNVYDFAEQVNPERVVDIQCALHIDERMRLNLVDDFIDKFKFMEEHGFNVYASQVMYPPILNRFEHIFDDFQEKGIYIRPKIFRGYYNQKRYPASYTEEEREKILSYLKEMDGLPQAVQIGPNLEKHLIFGDVSFRGLLCKTGKDMVTISYNGDVFRCHGEMTRIGNIFEGRIKFLEEPKPCLTKICPCPYHGLRFAEGTPQIIKNGTIDQMKSLAGKTMKLLKLN
jgi:organic radical activating enzyme